MSDDKKFGATARADASSQSDTKETKLTDEERIAAADARYERALHAMQSGVAAEMALPGGNAGTGPKHLRVGVNAAMVTDMAVAKLLIAKGIISWPEYHEAVALAMEAEVKSYETSLSERVGSKVTLG